MVNRTVYQAFLTAAVLSLGIMAPLGYFLSPALLDLVNAAPAVQAEALPYLRIMFLFCLGNMMFDDNFEVIAASIDKSAAEKPRSFLREIKAMA